MIHLSVNRENPQKRWLNRAVESLREGQLIIYPTDTVYGIGCNLYDKRALERLYRIKGKNKFDPISLIVRDIKQASLFARISNYAYRIMRRCLPGPYTFILPATREIPKIMLSRRKEVGIRIPENTVCKNLLEAFENPVVNTSVNESLDVLVNDPAEIQNKYQNDVGLMLDAGWLPDAMESTVVSLVADDISVLREGKGEVSRLFE